MAELADRILAGDVGALARGCRIVDERAAGHEALLRSLFPQGRRARRIGVTGAPGVGKSTLTDGLIPLLRARGERVGVVAVDPSSPFSGGALLGDRIRMQRHAADAGVFIRSLATRGAHGGLSRSAADTVRLIEAWGANAVLVETVGVGQAELEILGAVESVVLVAMPGTGDAVQANKAGILEIADVIALNKADRPGADATEAELRLALSLSGIRLAAPVGHGAASTLGAAERGEAWVTKVVRTVAAQGEGGPALLNELDAHHAWLGATELGRQRRVERERLWLLAFLRDVVAEALLAEHEALLADFAVQIAERKLEPYEASQRLVAELAGRAAQRG